MDQADERKSSQQQELSQKQENAMVLLLQGLSDADVGQQVGVDRVTVFRWRHSEQFGREFRRLRRGVWQRSIERVQTMLEPALDVLQRHLSAADPRIALRAAAILVRLVSPPKAQATNEKRRAGGKSDYFDRLKAYIDAPMPGEPGHLEAMRRAAGVDDDDDMDEEDEDEEQDA